MKIVLCTGSFKTGIGGVASYAHDFIDAFINQYSITVITNDDYQEIEPYPIFHIKMTDFSIKNARNLLAIITKENPDIIINSYFPLLSLITPFIANQIKIISISHFTDGKLSWSAGLNAQYIDYIIALSTHNQNYLKKKFQISSTNKIQIIYNYMHRLSMTNLSDKKNRKILKIVYPGGCSYQKSAEIVCAALKKLLKTDYIFDFFWLGSTNIPGHKWVGVKTKSIKDCLPNDNRLKHIGPVTRIESQKILSDANIFLLPSRGEGCPITLLEAMRGGCIPIISDAKHGSLDIIQHKVNGIVTHQNNVNDIVRYICDILSHPEKYNYMYDNTVKKFNSDLEYNVWLKKMESLLQGIQQHKERINFSTYQYQIKRYYLNLLYFLNWLKDRFCHQIYHFIYFRYIRHI